MYDHLAIKYDKVAEGFAENSYANISFYMHRRLTLATSWGLALHAGDSVLELGCGDGYLAEIFVRHGFSYNFRILPRPLDLWFGPLSVLISKILEPLRKTPLAFIGTGYNIEAVKNKLE